MTKTIQYLNWLIKSIVAILLFLLSYRIIMISPNTDTFHQINYILAIGFAITLVIKVITMILEIKEIKNENISETEKEYNQIYYLEHFAMQITGLLVTIAMVCRYLFKEYENSIYTWILLALAVISLIVWKYNEKKRKKLGSELIKESEN